MKEKMFKFNLTFVHEYRDTHKHTHICTVYLLFSQLLETKVIDNHFQSTQAQVEVIIISKHFKIIHSTACKIKFHWP